MCPQHVWSVDIIKVWKAEAWVVKWGVTAYLFRYVYLFSFFICSLQLDNLLIWYIQRLAFWHDKIRTRMNAADLSTHQHLLIKRNTHLSGGHHQIWRKWNGFICIEFFIKIMHLGIETIPLFCFPRKELPNVCKCVHQPSGGSKIKMSLNRRIQARLILFLSNYSEVVSL